MHRVCVLRVYDQLATSGRGGEWRKEVTCAAASSGADEAQSGSQSPEASNSSGGRPISRIIMRRAAPGSVGTKLLLNVAVFKDMVIEKMHEKWMKFSCVEEDGSVHVYLAVVRVRCMP